MAPMTHQNHNPQCATGNAVPVQVPVDPATFLRSGSGPVPAKYWPDRQDLAKPRKNGFYLDLGFCRQWMLDIM